MGMRFPAHRAMAPHARFAGSCGAPLWRLQDYAVGIFLCPAGAVNSSGESHFTPDIPNRRRYSQGTRKFANDWASVKVTGSPGAGWYGIGNRVSNPIVEI
jgi:hypothetical protein